MQVTDKKWLLDKWWSYLSSRLLRSTSACIH